MFRVLIEMVLLSTHNIYFGLDKQNYSDIYLWPSPRDLNKKKISIKL